MPTLALSRRQNARHHLLVDEPGPHVAYLLPGGERRFVPWLGLIDADQREGRGVLRHLQPRSVTTFDALSGLDSAIVNRLAELIEADLLTPPFTRLTVGDHVPTPRAEAVSRSLNDIASRQASAAQTALVLRAFAAGTTVKKDTSEAIQVVVSGPDPSGSARDTGVVMRQMFQNARSRVLAVGFAVHQGRAVFRELAKHLDEVEALKVTLCLDVRRAPSNTSVDTQIVEGFARHFAEPSSVR